MAKRARRTTIEATSKSSKRGRSIIVNGEVENLLSRTGLDEPERMHLRDRAVKILSECPAPVSAPIDTTGLVVGYVQSGKTLSFTTVAALARDNNYRVVIVITGTSKPLCNQSVARLRRDLQIESTLKWLFLRDPRADHAPDIRKTLELWRDKNTKDNLKRTILIAVMKQWKHLEHLRDFLAALDLKDDSVLLIDDEADQASLNNFVKRGGMSRTYEKILEVRKVLPSHAYVQYTATPQAPLLINIIDTLSPKFAAVLEPGKAYTGGKVFFFHRSDLVKEIPLSDLPITNPNPAEPPESLMESLRLFFLGVAAGIEMGDYDRNERRSMLVHPSQLKVDHHQYKRWVQSIQETWVSVLALATSNKEKKALISDFQESYKELKRTVANLPKFPVLAKLLADAMRITRVHEVNSRTGPTATVDWSGSYAHIVVGGTAMDRGFTVEGLTVTYMPRGPGARQADTIQQRARFFGYKSKYLGFCRVFLDPDVRSNFQKYVDHEEDIRDRLIKHSETGAPLSEWKRSFFIAKDLKPTRSNVIDLVYNQGSFADKWFTQSYPAYGGDKVFVENKSLVESLWKKHKKRFTEDEGHAKRSAFLKHAVNRTMSAEDVYADLLTRFRVTHPKDAAPYIGLLLQVKNFLAKNPKAKATVFIMSPGHTRKREADAELKVNKLFQGSNPSNPKPGDEVTYPGDGMIRDQDRLTVQIHILDLIHKDAAKKETVVADEVPTLAVWVPKAYDRDWLSGEDQ